MRQPSKAELLLASADIFTAQQSGQTVPPLSNRLPSLDTKSAYAIQRLLRHRYESIGHRHIGWKVEATTEAIGSTPRSPPQSFGFLTDRMWFAHTDVISMSAACLIQPRVRPCIALLIQNNLTGPLLDADCAAAAVKAVVPCLEVVDSRLARNARRNEDVIADNVSTGLFVMGTGWPFMPSRPSLDAASGQLVINGEEVARVLASTLVPNALRSLAWLGNQLSAENTSINSGQVILVCPHAETHPIYANDHVVFHLPCIGQSEVTFFL